MKIQGEVDACASANNITISPWAEAHVVIESRFEFEFFEAVRLSRKRHAVVPNETARADWAACL
jgi:hypothetical protein